MKRFVFGLALVLISTLAHAQGLKVCPPDINVVRPMIQEVAKMAPKLDAEGEGRDDFSKAGIYLGAVLRVMERNGYSGPMTFEQVMRNRGDAQFVQQAQDSGLFILLSPWALICTMSREHVQAALDVGAITWETFAMIKGDVPVTKRNGLRGGAQ